MVLFIEVVFKMLVAHLLFVGFFDDMNVSSLPENEVRILKQSVFGHQ